MKRLGAILTLAALLITMATSFCFADEGLTIKETYPKDGSTGASIENLGVKLYFSEDLTDKKVADLNKGAFQLMTARGKSFRPEFCTMTMKRALSWCFWTPTKIKKSR